MNQKYFLAAILLILTACQNSQDHVDSASFRLASPSMQDGGTLPKDSSCDGKRIPPALEFINIPQGTSSMSLIVTESDTNASLWIVHDIPTEISGFEAGNYYGKELENSYGMHHYSGACPDRTAHYIFTLYALDISTSQVTSYQELLAQLQSHTLSTATLKVSYTR